MTSPTPDFEAACQRDCDEYRQTNRDCHGYDYGNAWRAGRVWTLANDTVVRAMAEALEGYAQAQGTPNSPAEIVLAKYRESVKEGGDD